MKVVATAIKEIFLDMPGWSAGDLLFGLRYLAKAKVAERAKLGTRIPDDCVRDALLVQRLLHFALLADAAYLNSADLLARRTHLKKENILHCDWQVKIIRPCFFVAYDHKEKAVVLCIRGTASLKDALTDVAGTVDPFLTGVGHRGIVRAAEWFQKNMLDSLKTWCREKSNGKLIITGHSLGAGTAALLSMLLQNEFDGVECFAFAPPAVLSTGLCSVSESVVTSVICEDDIVPRFSTMAVETLRQEVIDYPWAEEMKQDMKASQVGKLAIETKNKLGRMAKHHKLDEKAAQAKLKASETYAKLDTKYQVTEKASKMGSAIKSAAASSMLATKKLASKIGLFKMEKTEASDMKMNHEGEVVPDDPTESVDEPAEVEEDREIAASVELLPPGRIFHLTRHEEHYYLAPVKADRFSEIILSGNCTSDHSMNTYLDGIRDVEKYLEA